jgi:hypothetical protein
MAIDTTKIKNIFDYLSSSTAPLEKADGAFIFCRDSPLVAQRASELVHQNLVGYVMFTGGIGKDSGYLTKLQLPEAAWQAALLNLYHKVPADRIYVESQAPNGGECARKGIDTIVQNGLSHDRIIVVCHATQLRRVQATLEVEAEKKNFQASYQRSGTNYNFDPDSPKDQQEAMVELLRLADWPAKGWCTPQEDLPEELVLYARDIA